MYCILNKQPSKRKIEGNFELKTVKLDYNANYNKLN